ncbi:hypothetical protein CMV_000935 [Castanea mollissima]|uniref:Uncharacterized protein n=1 Tax=Castanea mollissima TaxID=60419 RepID=A0A8J4S534_9ROSI|nr:hypothetical protein CMV_000935 [Castanea mollissima]
MNATWQKFHLQKVHIPIWKPPHYLKDYGMPYNCVNQQGLQEVQLEATLVNMESPQKSDLKCSVQRSESSYI